MIIIGNLHRLQQHLSDAGIDNQVRFDGSASSVTQVQEWFNTNPEFLEYQKQHGIRSVVVNHQHDAVITFEDDAHEAMYRLGEFAAIEKTEVEVDTLFGTDMADLFKEILLEQESANAMRKYIDGDFTKPMDYDSLIRQEQEGRGNGYTHLPKINFPKLKSPWDL